MDSVACLGTHVPAQFSAEPLDACSDQILKDDQVWASRLTCSVQSHLFLGAQDLRFTAAPGFRLMWPELKTCACWCDVLGLALLGIPDAILKLPAFPSDHLAVAQCALL